ncbi:hypothetical protein V6N13_036785 [Hibiscus sabdariffa]
MPLVLDEVTYSGMNEGAVREEGTPREVISEVRLQEKNDMVRWWGNDLWEGSPIVSLPPAPVLNTCMDLVNVLIVEETEGVVVVEDISLSDSNLRNQEEAILKEVASTMDFGKLLGVKTIGREDVIVKDIACIIVNSQ